MSLTYHDLVPVADDMADSLSERIYPYYAEVDINWDKSGPGIVAFNISFFEENGKHVPESVTRNEDGQIVSSGLVVNKVLLKDHIKFVSEDDILHHYGDLIADLREDDLLDAEP